MHRGPYAGRGRSWCAFVLKDGTRTFQVKMRGGRVGKTPPKRLWLKDQKSQAVLLKQTRPKSMGSPGAFGFQVETNWIFPNRQFRDKVHGRILRLSPDPQGKRLFKLK